MATPIILPTLDAAQVKEITPNEYYQRYLSNLTDTFNQAMQEIQTNLSALSARLTLGGL